MNVDESRGTRGARVLVVDDDPAMRALVRTALQAVRCEVREAGNAADLFLGSELFAPRSWPTGEVDLLIIDLQMPVRSGIDVVSMLRTARWTTPAILMTAFPDQRVYDAAELLGIPVLAKPFKLATLIGATRAVLMAHGFIATDM